MLFFEALHPMRNNESHDKKTTMVPLQALHVYITVGQKEKSGIANRKKAQYKTNMFRSVCIN